MRHTFILSLCLTGAVTLTACGDSKSGKVDRAFQDVNVIDENNLSDIMLTVADPNEAVAHFQRTLKDHPDRLELRRGLAISFVRAERKPEAVTAWLSVLEHPESTDDDKVEAADAMIRANDWKRADTLLDQVPPTYETFKRYRLEAMIADSNKEWKKADSFYETAVGLTTRPAGVMNNWGYSKLTRGDYAEAERLFGEAIRQDNKMFTAKNNLILARGAQRKYDMPVIPLDQIEKAQLLHTLGLTAVKQGDIETGKGLLREAVDTHPQHFETAVRSLNALESKKTN